MSIQGVLTGGLKRSSDVNVLPEVKEVWNQIRDDKNVSVDWMIAGYCKGSKTDVTVIGSGIGGIVGCAASLPQSKPVFGGCRLESGRFVTFFYADEGTPVMQKGRASMHKNGVLNTLEGSDNEIDMSHGITEEHYSGSVENRKVGTNTESPHTSVAPITTTRHPSAPLSPPSKINPSSISNVAKETSSKPFLSPTDVSIAPESSFSTATASFYSLDILQDSSNLPAGVDPAHRDHFLSDADFIHLFGIDRIQFGALPGWKKSQKKKALGLF